MSINVLKKLKYRSFFERFAVALLAYGAFCSCLFLSVWMELLAETSVWLQFVGAVILSVGVGLMLARLLARDIVKPLKSLVALVRAIERGEKVAPLEIVRHDELTQLVEAINHMTDRDKAVQEANQDPLTGLANRRYLMQQLENAMQGGKHVSVIFLDLDGFKPINDQYGHEAGDEALKSVSDRLGACVREQDILCRLGGDEFVLMFPGLTERPVLEERCNKVLELMNMPMWIEGNRIKMGASLGVSISPEDGDNPEAILNAADEAMYAAKQGGKNAFRFYS